MRIYQVLVIGSFVALAACSGESNDAASDGALPPEAALPANDVGAEGGSSSATTGATDGSQRPDGAVDPIRPPPAPNP
jgi:hypothetical protein